MDWSSVLDWTFKAIVIVVAIRYGWFAEREIRALKAEKERLEPLTADVFAQRDIRLAKYVKDAATQLEERDRKIDELERTGKTKEQFGRERYLTGIAQGIVEGSSAIVNLGRDLANSLILATPKINIWILDKIYERTQARHDMLQSVFELVARGEDPTFANLLETKEYINRMKKEPRVKPPG